MRVNKVDAGTGSVGGKFMLWWAGQIGQLHNCNRCSQTVSRSTAPGRCQLRKVSKAATMMVHESISRLDMGKSFPILSTISLELFHIDSFWMTLSTSSRVSLEELSSSILFMHLFVFSFCTVHFQPLIVSDILIARLIMLFSGSSLHKLCFKKVWWPDQEALMLKCVRMFPGLYT